MGALGPHPGQCLVEQDLPEAGPPTVLVHAVRAEAFPQSAVGAVGGEAHHGAVGMPGHQHPVPSSVPQHRVADRLAPVGGQPGGGEGDHLGQVVGGGGAEPVPLGFPGADQGADVRGHRVRVQVDGHGRSGVQRVEPVGPEESCCLRVGRGVQAGQEVGRWVGREVDPLRPTLPQVADRALQQGGPDPPSAVVGMHAADGEVAAGRVDADSGSPDGVDEADQLTGVGLGDDQSGRVEVGLEQEVLGQPVGVGGIPRHRNPGQRGEPGDIAGPVASVGHCHGVIPHRCPVAKATAYGTRARHPRVTCCAA